MKNPLKDKKIIIQKYENTYVPGEGQVAQWTPIHEGKLWAYYRQLSGREVFAAAQVAHINWRNDISPGQRIVYNDIIYEITRVDNFEGYKSNLSLYAKHIEA